MIVLFSRSFDIVRDLDDDRKHDATENTKNLVRRFVMFSLQHTDARTQRRVYVEKLWETGELQSDDVVSGSGENTRVGRGPRTRTEENTDGTRDRNDPQGMFGGVAERETAKTLMNEQISYCHSAINEDCRISFKSVAETIWVSCRLSIRFAARIRNQVSKKTYLR